MSRKYNRFFMDLHLQAIQGVQPHMHFAVIHGRLVHHNIQDETTELEVCPCQAVIS